METTPQTAFRPLRSGDRALSSTIRRWTREVAQLRTRAARLKRSPEVADAPVNVALEEAVTLCADLLQDLAGAELELQRCFEETRTERRHGDYLFDRMLTPCLGADHDGQITRANRAAALLLNVSVRHLVGQPLLHFTVDRDGFMALLRRTHGGPAQFQCDVMIRPRERSVIQAGLTLMPLSADDTTEWLWFLMPDRVVPAHAAARRASAPSTVTVTATALGSGESGSVAV